MDGEHRARRKGSWAGARCQPAGTGVRRPGAPPSTALPLHPSPALALPALCRLQGLPSGSWAGWWLYWGVTAPCPPGPQLSGPLQPGSDGTLPAGRQLPGPGLQSTEETHREVETRPSHPAAGDEQNSEGASPPTAPWPPSTQDNRGPCSPLLTPPQQLRDGPARQPVSELASATRPKAPPATLRFAPLMYSNQVCKVTDVETTALKEEFITHSSPGGGQAMQGHTGPQRVSPEAEGTWGRQGPEPLLQFSGDGKGEAGSAVHWLMVGWIEELGQALGYGGSPAVCFLALGD